MAADFTNTPLSLEVNNGELTIKDGLLELFTRDDMYNQFGEQEIIVEWSQSGEIQSHSFTPDVSWSGSTETILVFGLNDSPANFNGSQTVTNLYVAAPAASVSSYKIVQLWDDDTAPGAIRIEDDLANQYSLAELIEAVAPTATQLKISTGAGPFVTLEADVDKDGGSNKWIQLLDNESDGGYDEFGDLGLGSFTGSVGMYADVSPNVEITTILDENDNVVYGGDAPAGVIMDITQYEVVDSQAIRLLDSNGDAILWQAFIDDFSGQVDAPQAGVHGLTITINGYELEKMFGGEDGAEEIQFLDAYNSPAFSPSMPSPGTTGSVDSAFTFELSGSGSSSSGGSAEDTMTSGEDSTGGSATVTDLDENAEDGIVGLVSNLVDQQLANELAEDIAIEQQLIDDAIALMNTDNGNDMEYLEAVTEAFENYLEQAHPAQVQLIVGVLAALHDLMEEAVEWSALESARDKIELRKVEVDNALDSMELQTLNKILNRFAQNNQGATVDKAFIQGLLADSSGDYLIGLYHNDGTYSYADGVAVGGGAAGAAIVFQVKVTALRKALDDMDAMKLAQDPIFEQALDDAAVAWSQDFKADFAFVYDSSRVANDKDVAYYMDSTINSDTGIEVGIERRLADGVVDGGGDAIDVVSGSTQLGGEGVYWLSTETDDVAVNDPSTDTATGTADDYSAFQFQPRAADGSDIGAPIGVGGQLPPGTAVQQVRDGGQLHHSGGTTPSTAFVDVSNKFFRGGFAELEQAILLKHSLKKDPATGTYSER